MELDSWIIPLLLLLPLLGGLALLLPGMEKNARVFALLNSLLTLVISLFALNQFDFKRSADMQFAGSVPWMPSFGLTFSFGIDSLSLWLVLLTTVLMPLVIAGSFTAVKERVSEFYLWLLILQTAMVGTFVATDLIFFYVCFEFTLIPLYFLIGIYGSTQRLKAARVFFLYTFTGSMLTLAGALYVAFFYASQHNGVWTFDIEKLYDAAHQMTPAQQGWIFFAFLAGFAVKVPLFPVHTWLPLAHTEAPTAGSVILAGVLLKLGTYGLLRLAIPMVPQAVVQYGPTIAVLAIIGILYTALICWVQKDLKKLIAYSSVSHLGFCVLGMFALTDYGLSGSVMYMINHGLSTGALFLCVGMVYERLHTREMRQMSGLARQIPVWAFFMVFFSLASVGLPGLNGFVSEFLCLLGAFSSGLLGPVYAAIAGVGMIFAAIYLLYMVGKVVWGPLVVPATAEAGHGEGHAAESSGHGHKLRDLDRREILILTVLAVLCLGLGVYPNPILTSLDQPLRNLAHPANLVLSQSLEQSVPALPANPLSDNPSLDPVLHAQAAPPSPARLDSEPLR